MNSSIIQVLECAVEDLSERAKIPESKIHILLVNHTSIIAIFSGYTFYELYTNVEKNDSDSHAGKDLQSSRLMKFFSWWWWQMHLLMPNHLPATASSSSNLAFRIRFISNAWKQG